MAAPSGDDDVLLVSNEETTGADVSEDDRLFTKTPDWQTDQYHSSTKRHTRNPQRRFARRLGRWSKVLLKWWRTLVIILTPLILLLLFTIAEDTKVRIVVYSLGEQVLYTLRWILSICGYTDTRISLCTKQVITVSLSLYNQVLNKIKLRFEISSRKGRI